MTKDSGPRTRDSALAGPKGSTAPSIVPIRLLQELPTKVRAPVY
jgi:hypothetical protein